MIRKLLSILIILPLVGCVLFQKDDHSVEETDPTGICLTPPDCDSEYMEVDADATPVQGDLHDVQLDASTKDATGPCDWTIDWGDGTPDDRFDALYTLSDVDHEYAVTGQSYTGKVTATERSSNRETGVGGFTVRPGSNP